MLIVLRCVLLLLYLAIVIYGDTSRECLKVSVCKCTRAVDSASIDLSSLKPIKLTDGLIYWSYDPCKKIVFCTVTTAAICKNYDLSFGDLTSSTFINTGSDIFIKYTAGPNEQCPTGPVSFVKLICDQNSNETFQVNPSSECNVNFTLTTPSACLPYLPTSPTPTTMSSLPPSVESSLMTSQEPSTLFPSTAYPESTSVSVVFSSSESTYITPFESSSTPLQPLTSSQLSSELPYSISSSESVHPTSQELWTTSFQESSSVTKQSSLLSTSLSTEYISSSSQSPSPSNNCIDYLWMALGVCMGLVFGFIVGFFIKRYPRQRSDTQILIQDYNLKEL